VLIAAFALVLVVAAVVVPLTVGSGGTPRSGRSSSLGDGEIAKQANLTWSDFPSGWTVDPSLGPLGGLLHPSSGQIDTQDLTPAQRLVRHQYERCMGIRASTDDVFGSGGPSPTASVVSPVFVSPSSVLVTAAGSRVNVYSSAATVTTAVTQIDSPKFKGCFGSAIWQTIELGAARRAASSPAGVSYGSPKIQPFSLPHHAGATAVGVEVTVPVTAASQTGAVQLGLILVGGGRIEATLVTYGVTYAGSSGFPMSLTTSLTATLEHNVATAGTTADA
jgi:hypothetical protein